jgi:hypothetical protein
VRHVRMLAACLIAAFAVAVVAASSALAGPQWAKCEKVGSGGKYSDANCSVKAAKSAGAYELLKASQVGEKRVKEGKSKNIPFSGHNVGSGGVLSTGLRICEEEPGPGSLFYKRVTRQTCEEAGGEVVAGEEEGVIIECTSENNTGETAGSTGVQSVHVTFKGCALFGASPCTGPGLEEGEIKVNELKGKLGYLNKSKKEVGLVLEPTKKKASFASFVCGGLLRTTVGEGNNKEGAEYTDTGCSGVCKGTLPTEEKHGGWDQIISPITPINTSTTEFTQVYKVNAKFENEPRRLEGKHISLLENWIVNLNLAKESRDGTMWQPAGEEITNVNTSEEEGMIKA